MRRINILPWSESDDVGHLTDLLHRAYAPLAAMGLRFLATHQDSATTLERCRSGKTFLAVMDGVVVGTITLRDSEYTRGCEWYDRAGVASFGQFAVEPELQRTGIGQALLKHVEDTARMDGAEELALDTAEGATHLIRWYEKVGYRHVGYAQWDVTNYRSVIMSKLL